MNNFSLFKNPFLFISAILFIALFFSCKSKQKIALNKGKCILDYKSPRTLTNNLKAKEFKFDRLNAKLSAEAFIDSVSTSVTISLRMKRDSVIWMSISKIGIEGARLLITKDSVKYINRLDNKFFIGDFAYISKLLNTDLDFEILQSLFIGNSVEFYDEDEKIKAGVDNCHYFLGTIRKFKLRKIVTKGKELKEPAQSIYLMPETYKISRILFYEFNPDRSFEASFDNFALIDSAQLFPNHIQYIIKAQKRAVIEINYNKVVLNEEQSFPFKIPDNYEQIIYREKQ